MRKHTRRAVLLSATLALAGMVTGLSAQPSTLTIIVPAGAGSAPDIAARLIGEELRRKLGQAVVIENKLGAGGIVAVTAARSAPSPENTLLLAHASVATVTPLTYKAANYDLERDFEAVSVIAETPMLFVANAASGPKTLAEAISQAKAKPRALTLSSTTRGSIPHLTAELLSQAVDAQINIVPMAQSGQALQAIVSGDSQLSVDGIAPLLPQVKSGRLRALGVTSSRVLPGLEGLPLAKDTVADLEATGWFMLFASKGTPTPRLQALNAAVNAALQSPEVVQKLQATANYPVGGSLADARAFLAREKRKWAAAVQRAGMTPE